MSRTMVKFNLTPALVPEYDWGRVLHGPWTRLAAELGTALSAVEQFDDLADAVTSVIRSPHGFPARRWVEVVVDEDGWVAFGYDPNPVEISKWGHVLWGGCEVGFAAAEATGLVDPVDLAVYESYARKMVFPEERYK